MTRLTSYASPTAIGHRLIREIFLDDVVIQEKVDGSQFTFCLNEDGDVVCRSKGAIINMVAPDQMFSVGVETVVGLKSHLTPGFVYRGEYLKKPKHNVLPYDRVPKQHIAIFDIEDRNLGEGYYLDPDAMKEEAERLGFETVPVIFVGRIEDPVGLRAMLDRVSMLGGQKIEGVVVKNYFRVGADKKPLFGKFVSEAFKEVHHGEWRKNNPTATDIKDTLIEMHRTPARFAKARQHLMEDGKLTGEMKDIPLLLKEIGDDILKEEEENIKAALFTHFWPQIRRGVVVGLPEWYKLLLAEEALREVPMPKLGDTVKVHVNCEDGHACIIGTVKATVDEVDEARGTFSVKFFSNAADLWDAPDLKREDLRPMDAAVLNDRWDMVTSTVYGVPDINDHIAEDAVQNGSITVDDEAAAKAYDDAKKFQRVSLVD